MSQTRSIDRAIDNVLTVPYTPDFYTESAEKEPQSLDIRGIAAFLLCHKYVV
jgi:hypothetical protein